MKDGDFFGDSSSVKINLPGFYNIRAYDENNCSDLLEIEVLRANEIFSPNFLLPSVGLINDTIIGVEVSLLSPDSLIWEVPDESKVISVLYNNLALVFEELGEQIITMYAYKGSCWSMVEKSINIVDDPSLIEKTQTANQLVFKKFIVRPNPNDGNFMVDLELNQKEDVRILLYDQAGFVHYNKELLNIESHTENVSLNNLMSGVYVLMVNTNNSYKVVNVVID